MFDLARTLAMPSNDVIGFADAQRTSGDEAVGLVDGCRNLAHAV